MMRLVVEQGKLAGYGFDLERAEIVIGRGQDCDIVLDEHQVSRQHACLQHTPQGWTLVDLGSTNGTQVNGQPLRANQPRTLQPGDRVTLGNSVLILQQPVADAAQPRMGPKKGKPHPALLAAGAVLIVAVLAGIVVGLAMLLQDKEEETTPGGLDALDQVEQLLPLPTEIEGLATALPAPTQLEEFATAMPVPTEFEEMKTSLPVPTEFQEFVTALPIEPPKLPMLIPATPPPVGVPLPDVAASADGHGSVP
jgi:predicted component of type VI protein secretion system